MSKKIDIINMKGEKVGDYEIADNQLELEKGTQAVHDTVLAFLNDLRAGTASTKTRAEVKGSGKKPTRQKGLGRARAGATRNPVWRHGGIAFGPKPRDYSWKLNSKVKKLALKRTFSERVNENKVVIVDKFELADAKTKGAVSAFKAMKLDGKLLCAVKDYDVNSLLATGNIPTVFLMKASAVNAYLVLWADKLLFTKDALDEFLKRIG